MIKGISRTAAPAVAPPIRALEHIFFENGKSLVLGLAWLVLAPVQTQLAHARERRAAPPAERADRSTCATAPSSPWSSAVLRWSAVAALADGRCSGAFTLEAMDDARGTRIRRSCRYGVQGKGGKL